MFNLNITTQDLLQIATAAGKSAALSLLAATLGNGVNTREAHANDTKLYELNGFFGRGSGLCSPSQLPPRLPKPPPLQPQQQQQHQQLQQQLQLQPQLQLQQHQLQLHQHQYVHQSLTTFTDSQILSSADNNRSMVITRPNTIKVVIPPLKAPLKATSILLRPTMPGKFGLRLKNPREPYQPNTDEITKDEYVRCLNLIRRNELEKRQKQKHQGSQLLRPSSGCRPLRLRRLPGQRHVTITASASYKATRRVCLQY